MAKAIRRRRRRTATRSAPAPRTNVAARLRKARERHTIAAVVGAAALGYAESLDDKGKPRFNIPTIGGMTPTQTAGVAAFVAGMVTKNKTVEHVATGLLSAAAWELGKSGFKLKGAPAAAGVAGYEDADDDVIDVGFADADD